MYCETFDKQNQKYGFVYLVIFVLCHVFGGSVLTRLNIMFVSNNLTFFIYSVLFTVSLSLFFTQLFESIKKIQKTCFSSVFIAGVLTFFGIVILGIIIDYVGVVNINETEIENSLDVSYTMTVIAAIIFAPVVEELMFRFVIYRTFEKINPILAHICVAMIFGFFHVWGYVLIEKNYTQLINMLPYIVMSLGFSIVYQKTKNIWSAIILHCVINTIAVLA